MDEKKHTREDVVKTAQSCSYITEEIIVHSMMTKVNNNVSNTGNLVKGEFRCFPPHRQMVTNEMMLIILAGVIISYICILNHHTLNIYKFILKIKIY